MMEDMKNLLIQALETRGVLGQVRAKLRSSVFKIVDDQDQKFNMGCGLKWENPLLYKISDSKIGLLSAELIREFMELFKMDYSLSVFIPECSISPERIRKDEILAKLGIKLNNNLQELPTLHIIVFYFLYSINNDPGKIVDFLNSIGREDLEQASEKIVTENIKAFSNEGESQIQEDDPEGFIEKNLEYEDMEGNTNISRGEKTNLSGQNNALGKLNNKDGKATDNMSNLTRNVSNNRDINSLSKNNLSGGNSQNNINSRNLVEKRNEQLSKDSDNVKADNPEEADEFNPANYEDNAFDNNTEEIKNLHDSIHRNHTGSVGDEEIDEEILVEPDESYDKSLSKKGGSGINYAVSQSGGFDGTVDDKALEKFNYIEPIKK